MSKAHVHLLAGLHVEEREVNGAAAAVPGTFGDIALREEDGLVQFRVERILHPRVLRVLRPAHEMRDGALRTVGVVDLQAIPAPHAIVARRLERHCSLLRNQRTGTLVAIHALTHKVVRRVVANLQDGVRHSLGERHETAVRADTRLHRHASCQHSRQRHHNFDHLLFHCSTLILSCCRLAFTSCADLDDPPLRRRGGNRVHNTTDVAARGHTCRRLQTSSHRIRCGPALLRH